MKLMMNASLLFLASTAFAADPAPIIATHCEVFIDRAQSYLAKTGSASLPGDDEGFDYGNFTVQFWVKTLNDRMNGNIVSVSLVGVNSDGSVYERLAGTPFAGSSNYWTMPGVEVGSSDPKTGMPTPTNMVGFHVIEVKTDAGATYLAQNYTAQTSAIPNLGPDPSPGLGVGMTPYLAPFQVDKPMYDNLYNAGPRDGGGPHSSVIESPDQASAIVTSTGFPYLNPGHCN